VCTLFTSVWLEEPLLVKLKAVTIFTFLKIQFINNLHLFFGLRSIVFSSGCPATFLCACLFSCNVMRVSEAKWYGGGSSWTCHPRSAHTRCLKPGALKLCDAATLGNNPQILLNPDVNQRKVQFCTLLRVPVRLYGDSRNLNGLTVSLYLQ
jgi:hypothetical protein